MKNKENKSKNIMSIIYIAIICLCTITLITLVVISGTKIQENKRLEAKEAEIVKEYEELAKQNENIKNEDYAKVYFDGENMYIPSKNIIIEYEP